MAKKSKEYGDISNAPDKKKSDKLPVPKQDSSLGFAGEVPKMIPTPPQVGKPPIGGPAHGYGHSAKNKIGNLRTSGHSGAHHIGKK